MYENQTAAAILARMLAAAETGLNKIEGSFYFDSVSPQSIEMALAYANLDRVLSLGFAPTTEGTYLDYRAQEHGVERNDAVKSAGTVTFFGDNGTTIPAGSIVATGAGIQFENEAEVTIGAGGTVDAAVTATEAGVAGDVAIGTINSIPVSISGVSGVTNAAEITGGADEESDPALLIRLFEHVREPATSGNKYHYKQWAKDVDGIGDAHVLPEWDGNGTVKVVLLDTEKEPASAALVTDVTDYVEEVRPIGAEVTVVAATGVSINVVATLTLDIGYTVSGVQDAIEEAIGAYLTGIAFQQDYVSYGRIGSKILEVTGVLDYSALTVNGATSNVSISDTQVAVLGTVTLS
jgi:uncharacterized phage protein gp47/JayE